jgi:hypothetical protein
MSLFSFNLRFPDDDACWAFLESTLWPNGPVCPRCESVGNAAHRRRIFARRRAGISTAWWRRPRPESSTDDLGLAPGGRAEATPDQQQGRELTCEGACRSQSAASTSIGKTTARQGHNIFLPFWSASGQLAASPPRRAARREPHDPSLENEHHWGGSGIGIKWPP